jgi:hypothetical protein
MTLSLYKSIVILTVTCAECHIKALYTEYRYAERPYAKCRGAAIKHFSHNFDLKSKKTILNRLYL